ncbi:predicted protein [Sclerotinia sclerotiorum 1980 UF-70]|uniref:Uncharacterized protein n=1 Tax=Sclerotinia sclerotiorum (strain ATCC 18683 / 1980 / Ss-1) TaxID=665079 RepID=A7EI67_SCLS1|nr:predicted protein [Sclerotinia sclerotiorum 1980 UF-70]EDO02533.1 predicted protein [Sclerotinia sclerotiorum 1980 UF-70]
MHAWCSNAKGISPTQIWSMSGSIGIFEGRGIVVMYLSNAQLLKFHPRASSPALYNCLNRICTVATPELASKAKIAVDNGI